jgi:hypothetical protein
VPSGEYKEIGKNKINGIEVRGIEVNNPPAKKNVYNNFIGRMWVDAATEYPVRIEVEADYGAGDSKGRIVQVFDGFEWGAPLDAAIFEPNIPSDYTMTAETKMPAQDEASTIEGFRCFSEITKGKYPASIETMTQDGVNSFTRSFSESIQKSLFKDINIADSNMTMQQFYEKAKNMSEAMQPEIMRLNFKLQGPTQFYNKLTQEGKDPVYYGKDVKAGDANSVLMSWKVSDNTYRVIYGNLSAENVTAEKLKQMEQAAQK